MTDDAIGVRESHPAVPGEGRVLGVDWGVRRIGLAVSDPAQVIATPVTTLRRRTGRRFPMVQLHAHIREYQPVGVVVGLPLEPSGEVGAAAHAALESCALIRDKTQLPVVTWDERMTTARVLGEARHSGSSPPNDVDALAATVLLQHFLDARRNR